MPTKQLDSDATEGELRDEEIAALELANRKRIKADLAEAEADIARGDVEELDLESFLSEARRRRKSRKP